MTTGDSMSDPLEVQCPYCGDKLVETQISPVGVIPDLGDKIKRDRFYLKHQGGRDSPCPVVDAVLALGYKA